MVSGHQQLEEASAASSVPSMLQDLSLSSPLPDRSHSGPRTLLRWTALCGQAHIWTHFWIGNKLYFCSCWLWLLVVGFWGLVSSGLWRKCSHAPTTPQGPVAVSLKSPGANQSTWHLKLTTSGPRDEVERLMSHSGPLYCPSAPLPKSQPQTVSETKSPVSLQETGSPIFPIDHQCRPRTAGPGGNSNHWP